MFMLISIGLCVLMLSSFSMAEKDLNVGIFEEEEKGQKLPDPNDSDSFFDAITISGSSYKGVFNSDDYYDYYVYVSSFYEPLLFQITNSPYTYDLYIYQNSYTNLIKSYSHDASVSPTYSNSFDNIVYSQPGDTFYIVVENPTLISHYYYISANKNPGLSGISYLKTPNNTKFDYYYGQSNLISVSYTISNCSISIPGTGKTYYDAYVDAINFWNNIDGNVTLSIASYGNCILTAVPYSTLISETNETSVLGYAHCYRNSSSPYYFNCDYIHLIDNPNYYSSVNYLMTYNRIVGCAIHEIGHSLGLDHFSSSAYERNVMYESYFAFGNQIGDGDLASDRYLHG